jgi:multisubunit Na+/H+ antiporter MnhB subunit
LSKDLRKYSRETGVRLALGAFILLFIVGVGLIWLIYGEGAAGMGFVCLLAILFPIILILAIFVAIEWVLKRARPK